MAIEAYCPLCGVILQPFAGVQPPPATLSWITEVRAVKSIHGISTPCLTGVGYLGPNLELIVHPDESVSYSNADEGLEIIPIHYISKQYWVFPFHDACWNLLLSQTVKPGRDSKQVARCLFQVFYCTPWKDYNISDCGHTYGGATNFHKGPENPGFTAYIPAGWSFLLADPREQLCTDHPETNPTDETTFKTFDNSASDDVFIKLPNEVILLVLCDLVSTDVCSLRQASRVVANMSTFQGLPQLFWASRFEKQHEMGFAFGYQPTLELKKHTDWRRLYVLFKKALQDPEQGLGVKNRRRIWHILDNTSQLIGDLIDNEPVRQKENLKKRQQLFSLISSPVVSAEILSEDRATEVLRIGSRRLTVEHLEWPQSISSNHINLAASFTCFNGRSYISGLRTWQSDSLCNKIKPQRVGLVVRSTETVVCFNPRFLDGLEIALTISGIIGLRFLIKDGSRVIFYEIGDFTMTRLESGIAKLVRHVHSQIRAVQMGFDICKLVSVELLEEPCSTLQEAAASHLAYSDSNRLLSTKDQSNTIAKIWSPEIPVLVDFFQTFPEDTKSEIFDLHLNMDFAGPDGRHLSSLRRIVVIIGDIPSFIGLKFIYKNGVCKTFCNEQEVLKSRSADFLCIESSFYVDGSAGERLSAVAVSHSSSLFGIMGIELYTNFGNHAFLGIDSKTSSQYSADSHFTLQPPDRAVMSGFMSKLGVHDRSFKTFGIQSKASENMEQLPLPHIPLSSPQNLSIKQKLSRTALDVLGYAVQTTASLSNLSRVRVAFGANGLSRLSENISGLWLEYHDTSRPNIVGQWFDDIGEFELQRGEYLEKISIWTSKERAAAYCGNAKLGRVIAIQFDTSSSRSLRFGRESVEEAVHLNFSANTFEKLDTIYWGLTTKYDHVRVTFSPQSSQTHHSLDLVGPLKPDWIVPERLFWTTKRTDGIPTSVTAIHISLTPDAVTGLAFTYSSGETHTLGSTEGVTSTINLEYGEKLTRLCTTLEMVDCIRSVVLLTIYTDYRRKLDFRSKTYFEVKTMPPSVFPPVPPSLPSSLPTLLPPSLHPPPPLPSYSPPSFLPSLPPPLPYLLPSSTPTLQPHPMPLAVAPSSDPDYVFSLHPSSIVAQATHRWKVFEFPTHAEEFVGFWGIVGRRERRLQDLGPIFTISRENEAYT